MAHPDTAPLPPASRFHRINESGVRRGAFVIERDDRRVAELTYARDGDVAIVDHTWVDPALRGGKAARRLVEVDHHSAAEHHVHARHELAPRLVQQVVVAEGHPGPHLVAAVHGAHRVLDVFDVGGVVGHPGVPVLGLGGAGHGLLERLERVGQFGAAELRGRHTLTRTRSTGVCRLPVPPTGRRGYSRT